MRLQAADKLALMLTSAPSQRALAAYIGATHQQVGRWLQGERVNPATGAITNIPRDPAILANIDAAFSQYRRAVHAQARRDGLPYDSDIPINWHRLQTFKGAPSLRVVAERLNHLSPGLLDAAMYRQLASGEYYEVMVRSVVDLAVYISKGDERLGTPAQRRMTFRGKGARVARAQFDHRENLMNKLEQGRVLLPIWTKRVNILPGTNPDNAMTDVYAQLRQKHEPASSRPGTVLSDQVMFSLLPPNHPSRRVPARAKKPKAPTSRKNLRGRGPK